MKLPIQLLTIGNLLEVVHRLQNPAGCIPNRTPPDAFVLQDAMLAADPGLSDPSHVARIFSTNILDKCITDPVYHRWIVYLLAQKLVLDNRTDPALPAIRQWLSDSKKPTPPELWGDSSSVFYGPRIKYLIRHPEKAPSSGCMILADVWEKTPDWFSAVTLAGNIWRLVYHMRDHLPDISRMDMYGG